MTEERYVLIADDDPLVSDVVRRYLERDGLPTRVVSDGAAAAEHLAGGRVRLAVLDVMMPGPDGVELCRRVRGGAAGAPSDLPLILLTALSDEDDRLIGLASGADDYVTKPFSPREVALRVASVLRRAYQEPVIRVSDGGVVADPSSCSATARGRPVATTRREFDLLVHFLGHPGEVFTREELLEKVWGWQFGDLSTVTVHVKRLRAKLGDDHRIETVWGRGYRWGTETGDPDA